LRIPSFPDPQITRHAAAHNIIATVLEAMPYTFAQKILIIIIIDYHCNTILPVNRLPPHKVLALIEAASITGPAKNLFGFCRWLQSAEGQRTGLRLSVATFERDSDAGTANGFVDAAHAAGIDTYVIRERFRYDLSVIPQLRDLVAKVRPAIVETHNNKSHLLVRSMPAARLHCRWLAFHHGYIYPNLTQRVYNQLDRLTLRSADRVITVCQAFVPGLRSQGVKADRIRVLHNAAVPVPAVSEWDRRKIRDELGISPDEAVILSIGRLSREKGHDYLIQALARLTPIQKKWKLVLVGEGPDRDRLKRLTNTLGLTHRVLLVGFRADVAPFYAIADVLALPSVSEGSSNVLLEAMTARVPIVATRAGGNPESAIHEETALLVPPADPIRLADGLARLLTDRDLASRLAQAAQSRATAEFSSTRYQERLLSIYAEVLGQTP
jgi:glycosyltransferase involved in cell wall biosynthesis